MAILSSVDRGPNDHMLLIVLAVVENVRQRTNDVNMI